MAADPRKRSREEEVNEFMPLSKRINNLHLNNGQQQQQQQAMHMPLLEGHQTSFPQCGGSSNSSGSTCHSIPSGGSSPGGGISGPGVGGPEVVGFTVNGELLGDYCPDLGEHENPHYFNRNKVLYELYVERMRRMQ
uniref:Putative transcription factor n=1 Tax=Culex tarsalis TaxID=7177 RepID=A0A1Q3F682_CULTA